MTKRWALIGALLICARAVFAGDVSTFVNLGFSPDAKYFLFGQYGVNDNQNPYADLYTVNVPQNDFVSRGVQAKVFHLRANASQNGLGGFLTLFSDYLPITKRYHIDHLLPGRELYLLVDGEKPPSRIVFRDFLAHNEYIVTLTQFKYGSGAHVSSSFSIGLTIHDAQGTNFHYTVGLPNYRRPGVENYRIRKIILAPDNRSLVFVVEKRERDRDGINVRYMVETVRTGL